MIIGLGMDLVAVSGLREQLADRASHFPAATFSSGELAYSHATASRDPPRHLAARFAAKEATIKALDVGCSTAGICATKVALLDIEVIVDDLGRPSLELHGSAATLAATLGADRTWVSLSHDGDYACALVVLERLS